MVSCREFLQLMLDGWLANELPRRRQQQAHDHVAHCQDCANYVDSYLTTRDLMRQQRVTAPEAEVPEDLVQAILRQAG